MDISVVIPLFNEQENVSLLADKLDKSLANSGLSYEIILVDDGSTDETWQELKKAADKFSNIRLIRLRRNFGQTAAMSAGFHAAKGDIIVTMDADLQNDPADIGMLVEHIKDGADVVSGWRKYRKDPFFSRRLPSVVANALISKITGVKLHDYGCTLKAYRREVIKNLKLYGEMHRFIPALASWVGGCVKEVPVQHHPRKFGRSKYGISRTFRVVLDLMTVKFLLRYSSHPMQMFGKIALFFGIPGLMILIFVISAHISFLLFNTTFASDLLKRPFWVITPFMLILFCVQFISMGLIAEIQIRTYHESQDKPTYVIREIVEPKN